MTENEKKLLQAKHRLEEAAARDRVKERKARTRRLIQEGAILEKAFSKACDMELEDLSLYLTEKTKDSRLAREFVVALPTELSKEENISLLTEYVQENFVNNGMCADFCIHDTDGHNPPRTYYAYGQTA